MYVYAQQHYDFIEASKIDLRLTHISRYFAIRKFENVEGAKQFCNYKD